jgi:hypothetical protein
VLVPFVTLEAASLTLTAIEYRFSISSLSTGEILSLGVLAMRRATDWTSAILSDNVMSLLPSLLEMGAAEAGAAKAVLAVEVPVVAVAAAAAPVVVVVVVVVAAAPLLADDGKVGLLV